VFPELGVELTEEDFARVESQANPAEVGNPKQQVENHPLQRSEVFNLGHDSPVKQVEELGNADKNRDPFFAERPQDPLGVDYIEKCRPGPAVKRNDEIHDQGEDVVERKYAQEVIPVGYVNELERVDDVAI
jgi:hypothetical protein